MRALWTGEPVSSDGEFYPLEEVELEPPARTAVHPAVDFQQLGAPWAVEGRGAGRRLDHQRAVGGAFQPMLGQDRAERRGNFAGTRRASGGACMSP